jgi:Fis family transcriptional regulator
MAASAAQRSHTRSSKKTPARPVRPIALAPVRPSAPATASAANGAGRRATGETIEQCVLRSLEKYFADLDGAKPHALHEMVMTAVERPLLQFALERCCGNQSAAAELLGINRNTLRKRLVAHGLAT